MARLGSRWTLRMSKLRGQTHPSIENKMMQTVHNQGASHVRSRDLVYTWHARGWRFFMQDVYLILHFAKREADAHSPWLDTPAPHV
mmetsp:Transcript_2525/g.16663  ORF Transcript_2525/g.16663 Transcript_2525/m.16663 type:complete len:86 (-) Transcript_2525:2978-3235(-)